MSTTRSGDILDAERDRLYLLDVSTREHLFGVSLDVPDDRSQTIAENRFAMPLHRVRLFMQPQVHWEPVWTMPNERVPTLKEGFARSLWNGGPTLVGARSDDIVPTLPARLSREMMDAIEASAGRRRCSLSHSGFVRWRGSVRTKRWFGYASGGGHPHS